MCKKVVSLVWLACLLGPASSVFSADLEVPWGDCYVVHGTEEYCSVIVRGCLIVPAGATIIANCESSLDGDGPDGPGGAEHAFILCDGGDFICNARFNIGTDHDGYLIIDKGGSFVQQCCGDDWQDGLKFPDNEGGEHRIYVLDGLLSASRLEQKHDRDAIIYIGCDGLVHVENTDEGDSDPYDWYINGDIRCDPSCFGEIIILDLGGNVKEIVCHEVTCQAWLPSPTDGADEVAANTCALILKWNEGNCLGTQGRNFVYFGDCEKVTNQATAPGAGWNTGPPAGTFLGEVYPNGTGKAQKNVGMLPLWTTYCWRIDQACQTGPVCRGDVWTFTTGCELIGGDANLDCLVNFLDYAAVASTWMDEQFFPEGCTP